jgi:predicted dienelactone hydrolase
LGHWVATGITDRNRNYWVTTGINWNHLELEYWLMQRVALSLLLITVAFCTGTKVLSAKTGQSAAVSAKSGWNGQVQPANVVYEDWSDRGRNRTIPVKIYFPGGDDTPHPVVIFSHGLGGSREAAQYLGEYWSTHGYISVHVQHVGSDSSVWEPVKDQGKEQIVKSLNGAIDLSSFTNRIGDIKFVLDEIERRNQAEGPLQGKFDVSRIAISGHSYGAGTSLTMAGQKYFMGMRAVDFTDPRIKAAIYLSPPANLKGHTPQEVFGDITIPGLLMTGAEDYSPIGRTSIEERRLPFDGMSAPHQYCVTFKGGDHMMFNGARRRAEKPGDKQMLSEIERVTTAFLDAYLRGDTNQQRWLDTDASGFMASDAKFEHK